jgi:hypothetical protein
MSGLARPEWPAVECGSTAMTEDEELLAHYLR